MEFPDNRKIGIADVPNDYIKEKFNLDKERESQKGVLSLTSLIAATDAYTPLPAGEFIARLKKFMDDQRKHFSERYRWDDIHFTIDGTFHYGDDDETISIRTEVEIPETDDALIMRLRKRVIAKHNRRLTTKVKRLQAEQKEYEKYLKLHDKYGGECKVI